MPNDFVSIINQLLTEAEGAKRTKIASLAGTDAPAADRDPGGAAGKSTHPSAKVDGNTMPAELGARAAENERDVKKDQPVGVDQTKPGAGGSQDSHQLNIGMTQSATGEDPSVERKFKSKLDDPGTSSKANFDQVGDKYAGLSWDAVSKLASAKINQMLATVVASADATPPATEDVKLAAQAGRELADLAARQTTGQNKTAAAQQVIEYTIKQALARADDVGQFLRDFAAAKRAEDMAANAPPLPQPGAGGDGLPVGPGAPEGGPMLPPNGPVDPAMVAPHGEGGEGGEGHGEPDGDDKAVMELVHSLIEAGISPEQLMEALSDQSAADPAKVAHVVPTADRHNIYFMAKKAAAVQKTPEYRFKRATTEAAKQSRAEIVAWVREVCRR